MEGMVDVSVNAVDFAHALHSSDEGPSNETIATVISTLELHNGDRLRTVLGCGLRRS